MADREGEEGSHGERRCSETAWLLGPGPSGCVRWGGVMCSAMWGSQWAAQVCPQPHWSCPGTQTRRVPGLRSANQGPALLAGVCRGFCGYFETFLTINILCFDTGNFTLLETRDCHLVRPHPP